MGSVQGNFFVFFPQKANAGGSLMSVCISNRKKSHRATTYLDIKPQTAAWMVLAGEKLWDLKCLEHRKNVFYISFMQPSTTLPR